MTAGRRSRSRSRSHRAMTYYYSAEAGLSLRDYFANSAMRTLQAAILAETDGIEIGADAMRAVAREAYRIAGIMLEERSK